jgi:ABC-type amino acid transport substrate-binding protein
MMTNMKIVFGALLTALLLAGPALSQDLDGTLKKIKTSGTFTIGYREAAPPFSFPGPDKRPVGYSIDVCMQGAAAMLELHPSTLRFRMKKLGLTKSVSYI